MKKLLAIILALAKVFSLAACGTQSTDELQASKDSEESDGLVFGFVSKTTADPMFVGTYDGFQRSLRRTWNRIHLQRP